MVGKGAHLLLNVWFGLGRLSERSLKAAPI